MIGSRVVAADAGQEKSDYESMVLLVDDQALIAPRLLVRN